MTFTTDVEVALAQRSRAEARRIIGQTRVAVNHTVVAVEHDHLAIRLAWTRGLARRARATRRGSAAAGTTGLRSIARGIHSLLVLPTALTLLLILILILPLILVLVLVLTLIRTLIRIGRALGAGIGAKECGKQGHKGDLHKTSVRMGTTAPQLTRGPAPVGPPVKFT